MNIHRCSPLATCHNVPDSYYCTCLTGYTGDGFTCTGNHCCIKKITTLCLRKNATLLIVVITYSNIIQSCQFVTETYRNELKKTHIRSPPQFFMFILYLGNASSDFCGIQYKVKYAVFRRKSNCLIKWLLSTVNSSKKLHIIRANVPSSHSSQSSTPLVDCLIDDVLLQTIPCSNKAPLQINNVDYTGVRQTHSCMTPRTFSPQDPGQAYSVAADLG